MRKGKIVAVLLVVALISSMFLACAKPAEEKMTDIKIVSSDIGTGTYMNIVAMSAMVAAHSEWLRMTPTPTPGWIDSCRLVGVGRAHIAGTGTLQIGSMMEGTGFFEGEQYIGLQLLWPYMSPLTTFTTPIGSPFRTLQDLRDATVGSSPKGTAGEVRTSVILDALGFEPKKRVYLAYGDLASAMKDGTVDVICSSYSVLSPMMVEHTTINDCFFIPMDDDTWSKIEAMGLGFMRLTLPAGTYRLQDDEVSCMATVGYLVSSERVSDEIIYEVARCFWDNIDEAMKLNPTVLGECKTTVETTLAEPGPCPMHPGAEKYFKDKGMLK